MYIKAIESMVGQDDVRLAVERGQPTNLHEINA
jgi:hypothetical protein